MKTQLFCVPMVGLLLLGSGACKSSEPGTSQGSGGSTSKGGATGSGGSPGSGGVTSSSGGSSSGGVTGKGGATGAGGTQGGSGGTSATCTNGTQCGGDVVATWTVTSSCLTVSGTLDTTMIGLACPNGTITGSLQVTGTWTANSDGTYTDSLTTAGTHQFALPAACLLLSGTTVTCDGIGRVVQGTVGYSSVTCTSASSGGCDCSATLQQAQKAATGAYTASGNMVTLAADGDNPYFMKYAYCTSGNTMTWTPQGTGITGTITGSVVLQKQGTTGSGGAGGAGGVTGKGGVTGSGGVTGRGGATSAGGATGSGGAAGAGGTTAKGGATGSGGTTASGGTTTGTGGSGTGGSTTRGQGPCDIYAAASPATPCGAAYSMVRALSSKYSGPLYQVRSGSSSKNTGTGGSTTDIGMLSDGYADIATQDTFCGGTVCTVSKLYDQSGNGNDLVRGSKGLTNGGATAAEDDYESSATKLSVTAGGHKVYVLYMNAHEGYRTALKVTGKGIPSGNKDQGIYEIADGTHYGSQCCWDFGSVSPDPTKYVTMNTLFFGIAFWGKGNGNGPWFMGDFEGGVWAGGSNNGEPGWGALNQASPANTNNPSLGVSFAFGVLHTPVGKYALRMADLSTATDLTTAYDGAIPAGKTWGNAGGIALGIGGDNSNNSYGTFYEGALTNGSPSNATDLLVMKNAQAVGYKK